MDRWITDWEPSPRYPLYTRANAGEVLPEPPALGWTLVFEPGVAMGWADAHHAVGTLDPEELDPGRPEVLACFGGYLYLNAAMARIFGVRAPGLARDGGLPVLRAAPGSRRTCPRPGTRAKPTPHVSASGWAECSWPPTSPSCATCGTRQRRLGSRPDLTKLDDAALVARARSFIPLIRRMFERHLEVTAGASSAAG